ISQMYVDHVIGDRSRQDLLRSYLIRATFPCQWGFAGSNGASRGQIRFPVFGGLKGNCYYRATTYYRWRQQHDPEQVDSDRRCRELELEVDRHKRLVAELLLDKQMLQDIAKK